VVVDVNGDEVSDALDVVGAVVVVVGRRATVGRVGGASVTGTAGT